MHGQLDHWGRTSEHQAITKGSGFWGSGEEGGGFCGENVEGALGEFRGVPGGSGENVEVVLKEFRGVPGKTWKGPWGVLGKTW